MSGSTPCSGSEGRSVTTPRQLKKTMESRVAAFQGSRQQACSDPVTAQNENNLHYTAARMTPGHARHGAASCALQSYLSCFIQESVRLTRFVPTK